MSDGDSNNAWIAFAHVVNSHGGVAGWRRKGPGAPGEVGTGLRLCPVVTHKQRQGEP
jgi:hypothetical protein